MKAGRVCELALKAILVEGADAPPQPDEYADFFDAMNNWMASLEAERVVLGYTPVDNVSDEVTVPAGALQGIIAGMAIEVAPQYDSTISGALAEQARRGMDVMRRLARRSIKTSLPSTLPTGAGNDRASYETSFYGPRAEAQLVLRGNRLPTEFSVPGEEKQPAGQWQTTESYGFMTDITGRVTNILDTSVRLSVSMTAVIDGNGEYRIGLVRDGNEAITYDFYTLSPQAPNIGTRVERKENIILKPGQFIYIIVASGNHTNPLTVQEASLRVC